MASDSYRAPPGPRPGWTTGRVVSAIVGGVLALAALGLITAGGILLWADRTQRAGGYVTVPARQLGTRGYAVTSNLLTLGPGSAGWETSLLGRVRIRVRSSEPARPVFAGIAQAGAVRSYLANVRYVTVTGFASPGGAGYAVHRGSASPRPPQSLGIWAAQVSGTGQQTLTWRARSGRWMVVVMNASGTPGISVGVEAGATLPALTGTAAGLLAAGVVAAGGAVALIAVPARRARRR